MKKQPETECPLWQRLSSADLQGGAILLLWWQAPRGVFWCPSWRWSPPPSPPASSTTSAQVKIVIDKTLHRKTDCSGPEELSSSQQKGVTVEVVKHFKLTQDTKIKISLLLHRIQLYSSLAALAKIETRTKIWRCQPLPHQCSHASLCPGVRWIQAGRGHRSGHGSRQLFRPRHPHHCSGSLLQGQLETELSMSDRIWDVL